MKLNISGRVIWKCGRNPKTGNWLAVCPVLKLTTQGDTFQELIANINETLVLTFDEWHSTGDLQQVARAHGWKVRAEGEGRRVQYDIPFETRRVSRLSELAVA